MCIKCDQLRRVILAHSYPVRFYPIIFKCVLNILHRVRSDGLGRLAWFLANEEESMRKLPQFSQLNVENLANMMLIENPRSLMDEDTSRSVFQVNLSWIYGFIYQESTGSTQNIFVL